MDKSQLRRLALDYAHGNVDHESYVRERTELIDAIVSGAIAIERKPSSASQTPHTKVDAEPPRPSPPSLKALAQPDLSPLKGLSPFHTILGGAIIAAVAIFIAVLAFKNNQEQPASQPPVKSTAVQNTESLPPPELTAKRLVGRFLDANDWSTQGVADFMHHWEALDNSERQEALTAPWFRSLSTALKQAINAQRALASLPDYAGAYTEGLRLVEFARSLGIAGPFPAFKPPAISATAPAEQHHAREAYADGTATAAPNVDASNVSIGKADTPSPAAIAKQTTNRDWLNALHDEQWLIQLVAVNQRAAADRQINLHPNAGLRIIPAPTGTTPKFRIVLGPYSDEASAKDAFAKLPASLKEARPPLYRTVNALHTALDRLGHLPAHQQTAANTGQYTLQLMASSGRHNADKLVNQYPALTLRVYAGERFRVLYGNFESVPAAKKAMGALPSALLRAIGVPVLKNSSNPDGTAISWGE